MSDAGDLRPSEFWQEERRRTRVEMRRLLARAFVVFSAAMVGIFSVSWWAGSAVRFSASRADGSTLAKYRIFGTVRDAHTGAPVPWAVLADDPSGRPPLFQASADQNGAYELTTVAEPHTVEVTALGYRARSVHVGKPWYLWSPSGAEQVDMRLEPE